MGKIVISMRQDGPEGAATTAQAVPITRGHPPISLDSSAYYLLAGGLGGLGRSIALWMAEQGARNLIFLSRSPSGASTEQQDFMREIDSLGCAVHLVQGSVTEAVDVARAAAVAPAGRLKGVMQLSMVLRDEAFSRMSLSAWETAVAPKVRGTWNLHRATEAANLDFFVLFSSMSGVLGHAGQSNYAAGNAFLDAFAQWRTDTLGKPCCAVAIGPVEDVGYVAANDALLKWMRSVWPYSLTERDVNDAMATAMTTAARGGNGYDDDNQQDEGPRGQARSFVARSQFLTGLASRTALDDPDNRAEWRRDARMAAYYNFGGGSGSGPVSDADGTNAVLKALLERARADPAVLRDDKTAQTLAVQMGRKLFSLLLKPDDDLRISCSLPDLGMDSLVAIEMRSWWRTVFGFDISVLEMMSVGSLEALGRYAADGLLKTMHGS